MATYSFDTTPVQEAAITRKRAQHNAENAVQVPDNAAYVALRVAEILRPIVAEFVESRLQSAADAYRTASPDVREQVDALLGL
jgi:hypothetical protein